MEDPQDRPVVLAVDDAPEILAMVERALREDYFVLTAADAGDALDKAAGRPARLNKTVIAPSRP